MKYIGSKAKVAADIVPILQGYINEYGIKQYVEPFVGGFNIIDKCAFRRVKRYLFIATRLTRKGSDTQSILIPPRFGSGAENAPRRGISLLSANTPHRPILLVCGSGA